MLKLDLEDEAMSDTVVALMIIGANVLFPLSVLVAQIPDLLRDEGESVGKQETKHTRMFNTRGVSFFNDFLVKRAFIARAVCFIHGPPVFSILGKTSTASSPCWTRTRVASCLSRRCRGL